ncbi:MAG: NUDIX hydrolase [Patescibacteria group bacterium]
MESRYEVVQELVENLIAEAIPKAMAKEDEERARGMTLFDGSVARLVCLPIPLPTGALLEIPEGTCWHEEARLRPLDGGLTDIFALFTTATTFLTTRRMWPVYQQALAILREHGFTDDSVLYRLFHYVSGVAAVVEADAKNLVGVRSAAVAIHAGMVSIPGGLAKPGERTYVTGKRELREETSIGGAWQIDQGVMVRHPDAPSITFLYRARTVESAVRETYEAKGRKYIWVPRADCLFPALRDGDMQPLVCEFRRQGIDVPDTLKFAPDILEGCKRIYRL